LGLFKELVIDYSGTMGKQIANLAERIQRLVG